jgi:hypothetical protein
MKTTDLKPGDLLSIFYRKSIIAVVISIDTSFTDRCVGCSLSKIHSVCKGKIIVLLCNTIIDFCRISSFKYKKIA